MKVRIGTRRSPLALAQAEEVAARLRGLGIEAELVPMVTSGDKGASPQTGPAGVKGLFVHEIVRALRGGDVDVAVHSAKDLPSEDPPGVVVAAVPERADPFDVLVTRKGDLEPGGRVGTSSLRRRAQLARARPGLSICELRGNVDTRLRKLAAGEVDGVILAAAGLARLGITPPQSIPLPLEDMVPAPGQGALAVQARAGDGVVIELLGRIDHAPSRTAFEAERAVMVALGGGCALPLGAYAERRAEGVRLLAVVARPDGTDLVWAQAEAETAEAVAEEVVRTLRAGGA
ncbi:MAG TPA: hydroxymethylbilane synthase, partial [Actinomycetota bacterium]